MSLILVKEIREVEGGWIVEARFPYGNEPGGYGEVLCTNWSQLVRLLRDCSIRMYEKDQAKRLEVKP